MPCAMALKYEWCCKDKDLIKVPGGVKYCRFHAPAGAKGAIEPAEFNRLVLNRINECAEQGVEADLSGTIFEHDFLYAEQASVLGAPASDINFSCAVFNGSVDFSSIEFLSRVNFKCATFTGAANFSNTTFNLDARFDNASFHDESLFTSAHFKEQAHFFDAEFTGKTDFQNAVFDKEVHFTLGAFKAGASFAGVKYGARAIFKRPFSGIADCSQSKTTK